MTTSLKSDEDTPVMGAPAFTFAPVNGSLECSSFSSFFKVLALILVTLAFAWGWRMWTTGILQPTLESSGWLAAALALMGCTEWYILRGKTTLNGTTIKQTWVWNKSAELKDLAYVKLIRVRGLDWLIAPRLYTKTFSGKLTIFYAADAAMLAEFQRLEEALQTMRNAR